MKNIEVHFINKQKAFTLVEVLIVIVLIGILSSVAIPSYRSFVFTNRIAAYTNSLHGALLLARSEAIKRGLPVVICRSTNSETATPSCTAGSNAASNTGWGGGWIIFADVNNDGLYQGTDTLIRVQGAIIANLAGGSIIPSPVTDAIVFGATGQTIGAFMNLKINRPTADSTASHDRYICIAVGGRARVSTSACTIS